MYSENEPVDFDIYQDRWEFAEHMNFFIPACARSAYGVSLGNSTSLTTLNKKRSATPSSSVADDENDLDDVRYRLRNIYNVVYTLSQYTLFLFHIG